MLPKILIFVFAVCSAVAFSEIGHIWKRASTYDAQCVQTGFICENCTHLSHCFRLPNGTFVKDPAGPCPNNQTCEEDTSSCTAGPNLKCNTNFNEYRFTCYQLGLFLHPFNCKQYHLCILNTAGTDIASNPQVIDCPDGFGFDIESSRCSKVLHNNKCTDFPLNVCTGIGDMGGIDENPTMFYACFPTVIQGITYYFPQIFQCPGNYEFFNGDCRDPTPEGVEDGRCIAVGNFVQPSNCTNYIECSVIGNNPVEKSCSAGNKFDSKTQSCVAFQC